MMCHWLDKYDFLPSLGSGKSTAAAAFHALTAPLLINRNKKLLITDSITLCCQLRGANLIFGRGVSVNYKGR